jgi:hypothetical protein
LNRALQEFEQARRIAPQYPGVEERIRALRDLLQQQRK